MTMVGSKTLCLRAFMAALVAVLLVVAAVAVVVVKADQEATTCQGNLRGLAMMCGPYVQKVGPRMDPSPGCCDAIRGTDVTCVCHHIPKEIVQMLDMAKVDFVAQFCGKPLPRGFKCG